MSQSNEAGLDRPAFTALATRQAHLGYGNALVRRYDPDVAPFAGLACETPAAFQALRELLRPGERAILQSLDAVVGTHALHAKQLGLVHQMVAVGRNAEGIGKQEAIRLSEADGIDVLDLVQRTRPGPFGKRTLEMGNYIGIRDQGRLVAMAGERMHLDGYVEISAVCVDDRWRGRGLAGSLMNVLRQEIEARGETAFLHVFSDNKTAIALYERLGFEVRRTFFLTQIEHAGPRN